MRPLAALLLVLAAAPAAAQQASFQGLGRLPGSGLGPSSASAVSADGSVVVGRSLSTNGDQAFRWTAGGGMVGLGDLPGGTFMSGANGVSADGAIVVGSGVNSDDNFEAFRWTAASGMVRLGYISEFALYSNAYGVSADGTIVGMSANEAFRRTAAGGMVGLGFLSGDNSSDAYAISADGAVVVGNSESSTTTRPEAFRWTATDGMIGLGDLPGGSFQSVALGVSADGAAVVGWSYSAKWLEAFRWTAADGMVGLDDLPGGGFYSEAYGISGDGAVVVGYSSSADGSGAFRWTVEDGMQSVRDLLTAAGVDLNGWRLTSATAISADGTIIVGHGENPQGRGEAWRAVLPRTPVSADPPPGTSGLAVHAAPNPLRGRATLRFTVPAAGPVRLSLHDVLGREVAVVADGWRAAGPHEVALDAASLPPGVYVVRLAAGAQTATQRLTVVR